MYIVDVNEHRMCESCVFIKFGHDESQNKLCLQRYRLCR